MPIIIIVLVVIALAFVVYILGILALLAIMAALSIATNWAISTILSTKQIQYDEGFVIFIWTYVTTSGFWYGTMNLFVTNLSTSSGARELEAIIWPLSIAGHIINRHDYSVLWPIAICYFYSSLMVTFTYHWNKRSSFRTSGIKPENQMLSIIGTAMITISLLLIPAYYTMKVLMNFRVGGQ